MVFIWVVWGFLFLFVLVGFFVCAFVCLFLFCFVWGFWCCSVLVIFLFGCLIFFLSSLLLRCLDILIAFAFFTICKLYAELEGLPFPEVVLVRVNSGFPQESLCLEWKLKKFNRSHLFPRSGVSRSMDFEEIWISNSISCSKCLISVSYRHVTPQSLFSKLKRITNVAEVSLSFCTYTIKKKPLLQFSMWRKIIYILICIFQAKDKLLIQLSMSGHTMFFPSFSFFEDSETIPCFLLFLAFIISEILSSNCSLICLILLFQIFVCILMSIYFCWFINHSAWNKHSLFCGITPPVLLNKNKLFLLCLTPRILMCEKLDCLKVQSPVSQDFHHMVVLG